MTKEQAAKMLNGLSDASAWLTFALFVMTIGSVPVTGWSFEAFDHLVWPLIGTLVLSVALDMVVDIWFTEHEPAEEEEA